MIDRREGDVEGGPVDIALARANFVEEIFRRMGQMNDIGQVGIAGCSLERVEVAEEAIEQFAIVGALLEREQGGFGLAEVLVGFFGEIGEGFAVDACGLGAGQFRAGGGHAVESGQLHQLLQQGGSSMAGDGSPLALAECKRCSRPTPAAKCGAVVAMSSWPEAIFSHARRKVSARLATAGASWRTSLAIFSSTAQMGGSETVGSRSAIMMAEAMPSIKL